MAAGVWFRSAASWRFVPSPKRDTIKLILPDETQLACWSILVASAQAFDKEIEVMAFDSNGDIQDVLIIGGGPAGSTAGTYLARQGHRVTILEKEKFPRDHVGESLLPFCYKLLEDLGVLEQMKAMFVRKPGVRFVDTNGVLHTTWCFSHVIHDETYLSFQVAR